MNRARYIRELDKAHVLPKLNCCELDFCDRSPEEHSFRFADSRFLKDILCVLRESFMSPLLKIRYHEAAAMGFNVVAKGWSMSLQRQRAFCVKALKGLAGRTVLVLGCGFGDDAIAWIPLKPHKIIGVDIVNYNKCWEEAISHYSNNDIRVEFIQSDLVNHDWSFVCTDKVDIIFSYAVLEHISDLSTLLDKAYKVLKP
ncbi:MAG: class I SAM-dependent methyltransferase, partial [Geobacter sp.]|nr:class I SAM-dependent methyltransferase [Geobacter sp.]